MFFLVIFNQYILDFIEGKKLRKNFYEKIIQFLKRKKSWHLESQLFNIENKLKYVHFYQQII